MEDSTCVTVPEENGLPQRLWISCIYDADGALIDERIGWVWRDENAMSKLSVLRECALAEIVQSLEGGRS